VATSSRSARSSISIPTRSSGLDVFGAALGASGQFLRDAAIDAAYALNLVDGCEPPRSHRLRALVELLVGLGVLRCAGDRFARGEVPPRPTNVARAGWGLLAQVIETNAPLPLPSSGRMHAHLAEAGAAAAAEVAGLRAVCPIGVAVRERGPFHVLDLGGGAGTYAAAFLDASPDARATIVDFADAITIAREHLARFGDRVTFIDGDARLVDVGRDFDIVVLANLLHLHGPSACAELCAVAARAVKRGGLVLVKDLRLDDDRSGPIEGLLFALNMAVYTDAGDVYTAAQIRAWLREAGLDDIAEHPLDVAPDAFVIAGRRPTSPRDIDVIRKHLASRLSRVGKIAWREIRAEGRLRDDARPRHLQFPDAFSKRLAGAISITGDPALEQHYLEVMPRMRLAQVVSTDEPGATFMHTRLDWSRLPRMTAALDRLYAVLVDAGAAAQFPLGTPDAFRARTETLARLFMRTHYGACMPLLYGYPADLRYFAASGARRGDDVLATIDRYFVAPMIHELCHFARDRDALPTHLDECIGGWLGVYVWPEFAYPVGDADDALAESPRLAQVGQAFARAFGIAAIVRAQAGAISWRDAIGEHVVDAAEALCDEDWRRRRSLHLLSDTANPRPWVAFALAAGARVNLRALTLASLQDRPFDPLAPDEAFDRAIVDDAVRAMGLETYVVDGSMRTRVRRPDAIAFDAGGIRAGSNWYWIPPDMQDVTLESWRASSS
jgi:SAM-dependent methyltransferase